MSTLTSPFLAQFCEATRSCEPLPDLETDKVTGLLRRRGASGFLISEIGHEALRSARGKGANAVDEVEQDSYFGLETTITKVIEPSDPDLLRAGTRHHYAVLQTNLTESNSDDPDPDIVRAGYLGRLPEQWENID